MAVIVPFYGTAAEGGDLVGRLGSLRLREGDELIVADNTPGHVTGASAGTGPVTSLACTVDRSAYAARNEGAEHAQAPWLLFVDADCRLPTRLLDAYFTREPDPRAGAVAGQVLGVPDQEGIVPRYIRSRRHLDQEVLREHPFRPMAVTANLLVRREVWAELGGFAELTRSGADTEFSWRLQDAGWKLEYSAEALVHHEHRADLPALLRQTRRDGAGGPWLARRYPGYPARLPWRDFGRAALGALGWPLLGQPERGLFKALDGIWAAAFNVGSLDDNAPSQPGERLSTPVVVVVEEFPAPDGRVLAAAGDPHSVRIEARRRPVRMAWREARRYTASVWEDDAALTRLRSAIGIGRPRPRSELVAPARRLGALPRGALVLAEEGMLDAARELRSLARRRDLKVEPLR